MLFHFLAIKCICFNMHGYLKAVMGINALITEPIFSLARYSVKLSVNISGLTLTKLKLLTSPLMR